MAKFSRRGFLAGLLGVLAGFFGIKEKQAEVAPAPGMVPVDERLVEYSTSLGSVTTCAYDAYGWQGSMLHRDTSLGSVTTYCYDGHGVTYSSSLAKSPPPEPPAGGTDKPPVA